MDPITTIVIVYFCGAIFTSLVTIMTMPLKPGIGAAIWWPVALVWFIFHTGWEFIKEIKR